MLQGLCVNLMTSTEIVRSDNLGTKLVIIKLIIVPFLLLIGNFKQKIRDPPGVFNEVIILDFSLILFFFFLLIVNQLLDYNMIKVTKCFENWDTKICIILNYVVEICYSLIGSTKVNNNIKVNYCLTHAILKYKLRISVL